MTHAIRLLACLLVVSGLAIPGASRGAMTSFDQGSDPGVGPGGLFPNSSAAAASFAAASAQLGPMTTITFEGVPLGTPAQGTTLPIASAMSASFINVDHTVVPNYPYGITNVSPIPVFNGFNTTSGGSQFLEFVPSVGGGTASLDLHFQTPIQAFGVYLTGVGNISDDLHLLYNDGTAHDVTITGSTAGGIQFFGFTDPGASIQDITFEARNVAAGTRDVFGLDDLKFVPSAPPVPEPSAGLLLGIGLIGSLARGMLKRRR